MLTEEYGVHNTTSAILLILPKSNFALHSMNDLVLHYKIAPLSGEVVGGGGEGVAEDMSTAFAKIDCNYWKAHNLKVYREYKYQKIFAKDQDDLYQKLKDLAAYNFVKIMPTIIQVLRSQQMGEYPKLTSDQIENLKKWYSEKHDWVVRRYIVCFLLAKFLKFKGDEILPDIDVVINQGLSQIPLDYLEKSENEQKKIAEEIYGGCSCFSIKPEEVGCFISFFNLKTTFLYPERSDFLTSTFPFSCAMDPFPTTERYNKDLRLVLEQCREAIRKVSERVFFLVEVFSGKLDNEFSIEEKAAAKAPFGLIFYHENVAMLARNKYEYRSKGALVIGGDLKMIGVGREHFSKLMVFLNKHDLAKNVTVIDLNSTPGNTMVLHSNATTSTSIVVPFTPLLEKQKKIKQNTRDKDGYTLLHRAALNGNEKEIRELLIENVDIDLGTDNTVQYTALHISAKQGHEACVAMLLDAGADPTLKAHEVSGEKTATELAVENRKSNPQKDREYALIIERLSTNKKAAKLAVT